MRDWRPYKFGSFLNRADRFEPKDDFKNYTFSGTYSYAKGIFSSYTKAGIEFNLSRIQRIHKDDFIFCKIMAWEGAFGLAPEECDNTVMSGAFVAYEIDKSIIEPKFLDYFFKVEKNWRNVGSKSTGTNVRRKTLFPEDFEEYEIPLPSLPEQQRIVSKIESFKQRREQIKVLREEQTKELANLLYSYFKDLIDEYGLSPLGDGIEHRSNFIRIDDETTYNLCRVQTKALGVVLREKKQGFDIKTKEQQVCNAGEFLVAEMDAKFGGYGIVPVELDGSIVSSHYFLYSFIEEKLNRKYLEYFSKTNWFFEQVVAKGSTNYAAIRPKQVLNYQIPLPLIDEQNRIVDLLDKLHSVRTNHSETEKELTQLMPALLNKAFKGEL